MAQDETAGAEGALRTAFEGGLLRLTLDRPEKRNAIDAPLGGALIAAFERAEDDDAVRAVLLDATGPAFCAGWDLSERDPRKLAEPADLGAPLEAVTIPLIERIRHLEKPVVCAVQGAAVGAGANMAFACDLVLAARSARFVEAYVRVGLIPDAGGTWFLPHLVGEARAKAMALTGEPVDAETAERWGLIWRMVEDDALETEALAVSRRMSDGPTIALGLAKKAIHAAALHNLDTHLEIERGLQREAGRTPDYAEGVAAFFEKRAARFRGVRS